MLSSNSLDFLRSLCRRIEELDVLVREAQAERAQIEGQIRSFIIDQAPLAQKKEKKPAQSPQAPTPATAEARDLFTKLLVELCKSVQAPPQGLGRPTLEISDILFAVIIKNQLKISGRDAAIELQNYQGIIKDIPAYNTMFKYLDRKNFTPLLQKLLNLTAKPLRNIETSFEPTAILQGGPPSVKIGIELQLSRGHLTGVIDTPSPPQDILYAVDMLNAPLWNKIDKAYHDNRTTYQSFLKSTFNGTRILTLGQLNSRTNVARINESYCNLIADNIENTVQSIGRLKVKLDSGANQSL